VAVLVFNYEGIKGAKTVPDYFLLSEIFLLKKVHLYDLQTSLLFKRQGTDSVLLLTKNMLGYYCLSSRMILVSVPVIWFAST
jgi:hypothetical protein